MVRSLYFLSFLFVIICLSSCQQDDGTNNPVITVPVDFNLDFSEKLNEDRNGFTIEIETTKEYECENYEVDIEVLAIDGEYIITLEDIVEPLDCIVGTAAASTTVDLVLGNSIGYDLLINLKDVISNTGILRASSSKYSIVMEDLAGINWVKSELLRVPNQFIWGYISYEGTNSAELVDGFYESLNEETSTIALEEGDYDYFQINDKQALEMPINASYESVETFYYSYDGTNIQLQQWVDKYNQNTENAQMSLIVFTDKGQVFQ